jgi:hypothetical protein
MAFNLPLFIKSTSTLAVIALLQPACHAAADSVDATLSIDADTVIQSADPHRLTGTNLSLWSRLPIIHNTDFQEAIRDWQPGSIRMPGGSWSNEYYWNGNGVRTGSDDHCIENFDTSKQNADGTWEVDYSKYKKGFRLHGEERHLSDYHGDLDVKTQHEWINSLGSEAMVTVNVGSGTPAVAAEWVKWANQKQGYGVHYWEVGNELNGDWELGYRLPDGSSMNGTIYTQRFVEYAKAMHAVDPDIHLGGPACSDLALSFVEELIRDGGDAVDFVSIHAYPVGVNTRQSADKFAAIIDLRDAIQRVNGWISKYQPERADKIEIGISEWNIKVNEDRDTADLISALWSALWIGTLFEEGVDFANQWDLTTYTEAGGHSAFYIDETNMSVLPKSQYWALWMWSNLMGSEMVKSNLAGSETVKHFVTRSDAGLQIMLINTSETDDATVALQTCAASAAVGQLHSYSSAEYFWDAHARKPLWSRPPTVGQITINRSTTLTLPKFSINVLELPWAGQHTAIHTLPAVPVKPTLQFSLPDRVPADRPIQGWVIARDPKAQLPYLQSIGTIQLSIDGPATLSQPSLELDNAAAAFTITPTGAGKITIQARSGKHTTSHSIELVALKERAYTNWTFDNPIPEWHAKSTFELGSESSIKPNQYVAAARLKGETPEREADLLFHFEPLPREKLSFANASGVTGQLRAAHNLKCADRKARINIILQSDANHWMPIGSIKISDIIGEWKPFAAKVTKPEELDAMAKLYGIRFQIQSEAPITGDIYLDDLGFIFRTGL